MSTKSKTKFPVILLFGPTGVGKTDLVFSLFKEKFEIINADSMQVYKGMDVGTAKPGKLLQSQIPHHLLDIKTPDCQFNAGDFVSLADRAVKEILSRKNIPVITGGTAFYFRNYMYGLPESPGDTSVEMRKKLQQELHERGLPALYNELQHCDSVRAKQIHSRDRYRILRALEVIRSTGNAFSSFKVHDTIRENLNLLVIGLQRNREELYSRINRRVDSMFQNGLVSEVKRLLSEGYTFEDPGMRGIGYREFSIQKRAGEFTCSGIMALIKQNSRRYAKRQMTFFRKIPGVKWFHPDDIPAVEKTVTEFLQES